MLGEPARHYRFEELSDGVYAAIARPDGYAICNSGLVDLGDGRLVFDTGLTPDSAVELRAQATRILGGAPSVAVSSHRHLDHIVGNSEFATAPIWGTRRTREILLETKDRLLAEVSRESLEKEVSELEGLEATMTTDDQRSDLAFNLLLDRALLSCAGRITIVPPDHTFDTRLPLPGSRTAELVSLGSGHTEADAFLFLPEEKLLFAGDLVVLGVQPSLGSSDPEHWITVLDQLEGFGAERIVPGHGDVATVEGIRETRDYLSGVLEAARAPRGAPLPTEIRRWEGSVTLESNLAYARAWVARESERVSRAGPPT
ncbi:MAG TPA: MBL fold metallo-hydrolase [Thermoplasmata archaeon]|nr:MBL fold metallo-hydrolase [Thermoplasmata archaeon]